MVGKILRNIIIFLVLIFIVLWLTDREAAEAIINWFSQLFQME